MKKLLVDIGNSTIVVAVADADGSVLDSWIFKTKKAETLSFFRRELKMGIENLKLVAGEVEKVVVSSVVPELKDVISQAIFDIVGLLPEFFSVADAKEIIDIDVESLSQLGNDRLADAIGAVACYGAPAIVIDMGTATTIGVIDEKRCFKGGMIIPGVKTSLKALSSRASQLPIINIERPHNMIGKNTVECMQSGILYGTASMIDGVIDRITEQFSTPVHIVATGGISKQIVPYCKHKITVDPYLQFKGVLACYK